MTRLEFFGLTLVALLLFWKVAEAQQPQAFNRRDLVGVWRYVTAATQYADGRIEPQFGERPSGIFIISANGYYAHIIMAPDLPKVASGRFKDTTTAEAERLAEGVLAHFGTWDADERSGKFTVKIIKSSFSNFDGVTQVRTITALTRDTLSYVNDLAVTEKGARAIATLQRVP